MNKAVLNNELIAIKAGVITIYNYDGETREYISTSTEYLAVGVGIPACSCLDAPVTHKAGYAICRSADFNSWEYVPDHRGEIIYSTETGESKEITAPGDYPENTTTIAPLTPYDKWDGEKWVTDTEAQHSAAVEAAEAQRQSLIDAAMASISLIQLKLQAGRKLTQPENTRLNAVLDYIDAVTATDTSTAPDVIWPELPEAIVVVLSGRTRSYRFLSVRPDNRSHKLYSAPVPPPFRRYQSARIYQAIALTGLCIRLTGLINCSYSSSDVAIYSSAFGGRNYKSVKASRFDGTSVFSLIRLPSYRRPSRYN